MDKGEECEFVCKEFKFGGTSELFLGDLEKYLAFLDKVSALLMKHHPELKNDPSLDIKNPDSEFYIPRDEVDDKAHRFFY